MYLLHIYIFWFFFKIILFVSSNPKGISTRRTLRSTSNLGGFFPIKARWKDVLAGIEEENGPHNFLRFPMPSCKRVLRG